MPEITPSKYLVMAGWDDVPHLDAKTKKELLDSTPVHLRAARSRGIPVLGDGLIFNEDEDNWVCEPFIVPAHWPQIGGMDFGWDHPWAICRLAWDRDADTLYVVQTAKRSHMTPVVAHATFKDSWPFEWLPFAWPADGLQTEKGTGKQLMPQYLNAGFKMLDDHATFADIEGTKVSVEAGVLEMTERKRSGKLKVFRTCTDYLNEARMYHRKDGMIVKVMDDVISAVRYAMMCKRYARVLPSKQKFQIKKNWRTA